MKTPITKIATTTIRQWGNNSVTVKLPEIFVETYELYGGRRVTIISPDTRGSKHC
ncbi:MAG: hypothetical protein IPJ03_16750 [Ignavibacteriales bacterium]|nr:hypothetical protein [Ignavibacteriales bacterium]